MFEVSLFVLISNWLLLNQFIHVNRIYNVLTVHAYSEDDNQAIDSYINMLVSFSL